MHTKKSGMRAVRAKGLASFVTAKGKMRTGRTRALATSRMRAAGVVAVACLCGLLSACTEAHAPEPSSSSKSTATSGSGQPSPQSEQKRTAEEPLDQEVNTIIASLSTEEKVAQLFVPTPEQLVNFSGTATQAGDATRSAFEKIPVGGVIYTTANLVDPQQTKEMLSQMQAMSQERLGVPIFLSIDEEGGTVARISGRETFGIPNYPNMADVGAAGDSAQAKNIGREMGEYLSDLGFNLDFAPVADVLSNENNNLMRLRVFGSDPQIVSTMASSFMTGLQEYPVLATYKHFPGHGSTQADSHIGEVISGITSEQLHTVDLEPYRKGIANGLQVIMVGHMAFPEITGDSVPCTLSPWAATDLARNELGFEGILITDAMNMGAVSNSYSSGEAAVKAVQAGIDMILMPEDLSSAYNAVLASVNNGSISHERLDESLRRILTVKLSYVAE